MFYTIVFVDNNNAEIARTVIIADSYGEAHKKAASCSILCGGGKIASAHIYENTTDADGHIDAAAIHRAAVTVAKRTTNSMINRWGGELAHTLFADVRNPILEDIESLLIAKCSGRKDINADVEDMISAAQEGIFSALCDGLDIVEQYAAGYKTLNRYLYHSGKAPETAVRTLYIEDISGDIVNVTAEIGRILAPDEPYLPHIENIEDSQEGKKRAFLYKIIPMLSVTQRKILSYMALGWSQRQIARELGRAEGTIAEHIKRIRKTSQKAIAA